LRTGILVDRPYGNMYLAKRHLTTMLINHRHWANRILADRYLTNMHLAKRHLEQSIRNDISTNAQTLKHNINNVCNLIKLKQAI
jgi:hypothetical protein